MGTISPMQLAKKLGVRPQALYGLIRRGKIKSKEVGGKIFVDEDEATNVLRYSQRPPKQEGDEDGDAAKRRVERDTPTGTILGYQVNPSSPHTRRHIQMQQVGRNLIKAHDTAGHRIDYIRTDRWEELMKNRKLIVEGPETLLHMVAYQLDLKGEEEAAASLRAWIEQWGGSLKEAEVCAQNEG
jgi:hypothetical protein